MSFNFQDFKIFQIKNFKNKGCCCLIKSNVLSPNKLYFTQETEILLPKIINFVNEEYSFRKTINFHYDLNKNLYLFFSNFDTVNKYDLAIPQFECIEFICMTCNKLHNSKSQKCCELSKSPLKILKARLRNIYVCSNYDYIKTIEKINKEFIMLHFPDLMDKIIIL